MHAEYGAIFLNKLTRHQLLEELSDLLGLMTSQLGNVYTRGPSDINVDVTDSVSVQSAFFVRLVPVSTQFRGVQCLGGVVVRASAL